jgi:hypothetical protein
MMAIPSRTAHVLKTCGTTRFASPLQQRVFMTRQTTFLVQAFNISKGTRLKANAPIACSSAEGARRTAERLALNNLGVVAFSMTADPETGDYDDEPTVFFRAGQLPVEFDLMP